MSQNFLAFSAGIAIALFFAILLFLELGRQLGLRQAAKRGTAGPTGVSVVDGAVFLHDRKNGSEIESQQFLPHRSRQIRHLLRITHGARMDPAEDLLSVEGAPSEFLGGALPLLRETRERWVRLGQRRLLISFSTSASSPSW